jgi:two-component system, OmpR family, phosphate regulon sensor histidine kinase PhoR
MAYPVELYMLVFAAMVPVGVTTGDAFAAGVSGGVALVLAVLLCSVVGALVACLLERRRVASHGRALTEAVTRIGGTSSGFVNSVGRPLWLWSLADALEKAEARLRLEVAAALEAGDGMVAVLSRLHDGVIVTDDLKTVTFVNRAQLARLRLSEERVVGRSLIEVVQDHEIDSLVEQCLATRSERKLIVETLPSRRYTGVVATPLGHGGGCVVVLQDMTELRRLEKVRRDFVANISHELRTPLASLKLLAETLESGGTDDPELTRDYLGRIGIEVDRLAQMVDELGELSLIETGQVRLEMERLNVSALVVRAVERLEAQAVRAGIRLEAVIPGDLPEPLGDRRRLEQVLVNLLHNAIKFTPEGGRVVVSAREDGEGVVVAVSDTGIGIAEDDLPRVFERFYKVDKSRSSRGTGLGLAIARHIVEAHHGTLRVESIEGKGSTFSFWLPLSAD